MAGIRTLIASACLCAAMAVDTALTNVTVTHVMQPGSVTVTLDVVVHYPTESILDSPPFMVLLNGAPVLAEQYSDLASNLASRGFVVAIPQHSARLVIDDPTCSVQYPPFPTARSVNSLHEYFIEESPAFLGNTDVNAIILMGHSAGGGASVAAASGACDGIAGIFNPLCESYSRMYDPVTGDDMVKGLLLFEGYDAQIRTFPDHQFVAYIGSTYNLPTENAYANLTDAKQKSLVIYDKMNHYSVNNYVADIHIAPCGGPRSGDEALFSEDEPNHIEGVALIADFFYQNVMAFYYNDVAAWDYLVSGVKSSPRYTKSSYEGCAYGTLPDCISACPTTSPELEKCTESCSNAC